MKKIKLRKRKRKVYFQYEIFKPLRYYDRKMLWKKDEELPIFGHYEQLRFIWPIQIIRPDYEVFAVKA